MSNVKNPLSMSPIFIFGTLCYAPLLEAVAGVPLRMEAAALPGYRAAWVAGKSWPMLEEREGTLAQGALILPEPRHLERLDFYEACFAYTRRAVRVIWQGEEIAAEAWFPPEVTGRPGNDWSLEDWAMQWGELTALAAAEVMRQYGREAPEAVGKRFGIIRARADAVLRSNRWTRRNRLGGGLDRSDISLHGVNHAYEGFLTLQELKVSHRRFDGGVAGPMVRAICQAADAVTVLPYDPIRDRILLIEQIRLAPFVHGDPTPWLLEAIAGLIDAGETPEATARREAMEEANLNIGTLHPVGRYYPTPGGIAQVLISYIGIADLPEKVTGLGGVDDENEDIRSILVDYETACQMLAEGDMPNAPLMISMQYLMLHRDRLRAKVSLG